MSREKSDSKNYNKKNCGLNEKKHNFLKIDKN